MRSDIEQAVFEVREGCLRFGGDVHNFDMKAGDQYDNAPSPPFPSLSVSCAMISGGVGYLMTGVALDMMVRVWRGLFFLLQMGMTARAIYIGGTRSGRRQRQCVTEKERATAYEPTWKHQGSDSNIIKEATAPPNLLQGPAQGRDLNGNR